MANRTMSRIAVAVLLLALVVAGNAFIFRGRLSRWAADITAPAIAPIAARISATGGFFSTLLSRDDVVAENLRLSEEVERLRSQVAGIEELRREVDFYRVASGFSIRGSREPIVGAVFAYPVAAGTREVILNRGIRQGVAAGDIVATPTGALVGVVREAFDDHAIIVALGDPSFEVTGRILGSEVTGLVRANGSDGLVLDLVSRDEAVSEGQVIVTSGNDRFPAGLTLGTIRSVDANQTTLFTVVRLESAIRQPMAGHVLVIRLE